MNVSNPSEEIFFIFHSIKLERPWLETIFKGKFIEFTFNYSPFFFFKNCQNTLTIPNIILGKDLFLQSELKIFFKKILDLFSKKEKKINLIQLGDELGEKLYFEFYEHPSLNRIIRNYSFPYTTIEIKDISEAELGKHYIFPKLAQDKIYIFPLGTFQFYQGVASDLPNFQNRPLIWSFIGRKFHGRDYELNHIRNIQPSFCRMTNDFLSQDSLGPTEYQEYLKKSKFIPTVCGCNPETFRFYESIEFGAIPLYIRQPFDESHWLYLKTMFPNLLEIKSLVESEKILSNLYSYKSLEEWEEYRQYLYETWQNIKKNPLIKLTNIYDIKCHK